MYAFAFSSKMFESLTRSLMPMHEHVLTRIVIGKDHGHIRNYRMLYVVEVGIPSQMKSQQPDMVMVMVIMKLSSLNLTGEYFLVSKC